MTGSPGHTVLQVPVPPLESFVRARHEHYDREWVSADPSFTHAHVTALGPWLQDPGHAALSEIEEITAQVPPFDFVLARVATFPNGIIHLVPEPDRSFRELTDRLVEAFPACPPYAGQFEPVPHLTLDARSATVYEESTRALLGGLLPVHCRAERLDLAWYAAGDCRLLHHWPLGG